MTDFLIVTSKEDVASMNIRDNLLNSDLFKFKLSNYKWKGNPLFVLQDMENWNLSRSNWNWNLNWNLSRSNRFGNSTVKPKGIVAILGRKICK